MSHAQYVIPFGPASWGTPDAGLSEAPQTLPQAFAQRVAATPNAVAQRFQDTAGRWQDVTWRTLWDETQVAMERLQRQGLEQGDYLVILAGTGREWQVYELAGSMLGAVIVGIDPHACAEGFKVLMASVSEVFLVTDCLERLADLSVSIRLGIKNTIVIGSGQTPPNPPSERGGIRPGSYRGVGCFSASGSTATLLLSSGTTGEPKLLGFTHAQLLSAGHAIRDAFPGLGIGDRHICWLPMSHLFQRMLNLTAMLSGVTTCFCEDPKRIFSCIKETQPTFFVGVPRFYEKLYQGIQQRLQCLPGGSGSLAEYAISLALEKAVAAKKGSRLPGYKEGLFRVLNQVVLRRLRGLMGGQLKFMVSGSAPISPALLDYFNALGLPILEAYGVSENTVPIALNRLEAHRYGSVGKALAPNLLRIARDGEILVKSSGLSKDIQQECDADGYHRTGDLGYRDAQGYLFLAGRKKTMFKTSTGRKVFPEKVEAAYLQCPGINQVVVFGCGKPYLTGLLEVADKNRDRGELRNALSTVAEQLPEHERVYKFAILREPLRLEHGELTSSLKVRRKKVEQRHGFLLKQLCDADRLSVHASGPKELLILSS